MATMAGRQINQTYGDVLSIDNSNSGVDGTYRVVQSGDGTESGLQLSSAGARIPSGKALVILGTFNFASASTVTGTVALANGGLGVTTAASARTVLGGGTAGIAVFRSAAAASGRTALGSGTNGDALFVSSTAASGRTLLGAATVGEAVFLSAAAASARTALSLGTAAVANTGVSNGNVPAMDGTGYPAANGSQITALNATQLTSGTIPAARITFASQANQEAGTSTTVPVNPAVQQFHPSAVKGWVMFSAAAAISASYNVSGVTDGGNGFWTVAWDTDFSSATYGIALGTRNSGTSGAWNNQGNSQAAGSIVVQNINASGNRDDGNIDRQYIAAFGDQ